jgi:murein DD-endopeptidase MepM/ murein hydrolase activator NlpD
VLRVTGLRASVLAVCAASFLASGAALGSTGSSSPAKGRTKKTSASHHAKAPRKAHHRIRQDAAKRIVVDRLDELDVYGPFLPAVAYDYPRPPCPAVDTIRVARLHDSDLEGPEPKTVAEAARKEDPPQNALARVAHTLGSLLRPKSAQSTVRLQDVDLSDLLEAGVQIPVEGVDAARLRDSFLASRGRHRKHLAIDIGAPKGTPVLAAADGEIIKMRREKRGGISLYQKDATGRYLLFYCHLSRYEKGLRPGQKVSKGEVIAYVGRTGHVIGGSHLHFSLTRLPDDDDNFKAGVAVNPYLLFLASVQ